MENKELLIQYDQEVNRLFQENKKLKEDFKIIKQLQLKTLEEHNNLKSRINKAIEHLKKSTYYNVSTKEYFDLLKILKGEENE